jgi:hypothetical protein
MLAACQQAAAPSATGPTTPPISSLVHVFGRVVDFQTNAGVANATIAFYIPPYPITGGTVIADASGSYSVQLPPGAYIPRINGDSSDKNAGTIVPFGTRYRADYFVNGGDCVVFYGTIPDATTAQPIGDATINFVRTTQSAADGSCRLDLGCPDARARTIFPPPFGTGTAFMTVAADGYIGRQAYGNRREFLVGLQRIDVNSVRVSD